jgi:hypothetical protein
MHDCQVRFDFWFGALVSVVILTGCSVPARAQEAVPARIGPFRAGFDPLESTLMAKTALAVDQLPRRLAVQKLAESHGIRIRLNEEALADAGVKLDAPVNASFRNFTLRAALFHVLGNDDLCFDFGAGELVVSIGPQNVPEAAPRAARVRLQAVNDAARLGFQLRVLRLPGGNAAMAQINGAWIQYTPPQDLDVAEAPPAGVDDPPKMQISFEPGTIGHVAFWRDRSAITAQERLVRLLGRRIAAVDRICHLTDRQHEKLRLAGRGDVKRLLDRAAAIAARLVNPGSVGDAEEFVQWARALADDAETLRLDLETGSFDARSLFAKALKRTLTPEQSAAYFAAPFAEQ